MGIRSRTKKEKRQFRDELLSYEKGYFKELRRLIDLSEITSIPLNLKPTRSIIYECKDGYAIVRLTRENLPDKIETVIQNKLSVSEAINQYKFKSISGRINDVQIFPGPLSNIVAAIALPIVKENNELFYPDYHTVLVYGQRLIGDPIKDATKDFSTFIIAKNLSIDLTNRSNYIISTIERLERLLLTFEDVLADGIREEEVQKFLDDHPIILNPVAIRHIPKMKIGKYFSDFTFVEVGNKYQFVEIERTDHVLLTKKLDFTAAVNHGWQQLLDWDMEIEGHKKEIESKHNVSNIENRKFLLVIGRSKNLSNEDIMKIRTRSRTSGKCDILTYDDVLESFRMLIVNLKKNQ